MTDKQAQSYAVIALYNMINSGSFTKGESAEDLCFRLYLNMDFLFDRLLVDNVENEADAILSKSNVLSKPRTEKEIAEARERVNEMQNICKELMNKPDARIKRNKNATESDILLKGVFNRKK